MTKLTDPGGAPVGTVSAPIGGSAGRPSKRATAAGRDSVLCCEPGLRVRDVDPDNGGGVLDYLGDLLAEPVALHLGGGAGDADGAD